MSGWRHLKKLAENLAILAWYAVAVLGLSGQMRFFCQDETRLAQTPQWGRNYLNRQAKRQSAVAV